MTLYAIKGNPRARVRHKGKRKIRARSKQYIARFVDSSLVIDNSRGRKVSENKKTRSKNTVANTITLEVSMPIVPQKNAGLKDSELINYKIHLITDLINGRIEFGNIQSSFDKVLLEEFKEMSKKDLSNKLGLLRVEASQNRLKR